MSAVAADAPWLRFARDYASSRVALAGFVLLALILGAALAAPWLAPQNPYDLMQSDILDSRLPPNYW